MHRLYAHSNQFNYVIDPRHRRIKRIRLEKWSFLPTNNGGDFGFLKQPFSLQKLCLDNLNIKDTRNLKLTNHYKRPCTNHLIDIKIAMCRYRMKKIRRILHNENYLHDDKFINLPYYNKKRLLLKKYFDLILHCLRFLK